MRPPEAYDRAKMHMAGEALLIVEFGAELTLQLNDAALAFDQYLQDNPVEGLLESAPTSNAVALRFDPLEINPKHFRTTIEGLVRDTNWFSQGLPRERKCWRLPVCYGGQSGPDLAQLAEQLDKSPGELVEAHLAGLQRVFMIGFAPGFLYTGMLPKLFDLPRLKTIKPMVPAGSVSVAIGQTVISATPAPTGWHTIGRTPFVNFAPLGGQEREAVFQISAGDDIQFYSITASEYEDLHSRPGQGLLRACER